MLNILMVRNKLYNRKKLNLLYLTTKLNYINKLKFYILKWIQKLEKKKYIIIFLLQKTLRVLRESK